MLNAMFNELERTHVTEALEDCEDRDAVVKDSTDHISPIMRDGGEIKVKKVLGKQNPADALTKCEGAHFEPMSRLLRTSTFSIREESEELEQRRAVKDVLGYVPRPRSMPSGHRSTQEG